ncbi:hypothetical protein BI364_09125 [Acidihalobacter yilgarnensis]|uniref:Chorismate-utilising enzyme C-terminal domain-containing protein n=1 Tax=Acidihalobacter yilgarnensis TaxID=2819280 RepID=A0A1D8INR1_9GAMM|nr:aminodeoxychorismate synthase component I [Acidihalobacter yilgarnensis]AOU98099.1 hypothetical protein BI364_09125 [Acidihalobacter yilgarnensis]
MPAQRPLRGPDDLLALHRLDAQRYPHLLQSVTRDGARGRYDILFAFPERTFVDPDGTRFADWLDSVGGQPFGRKISADEPPFTGGWFLYLGYELAYGLEPVLGQAPAHPWGWPAAAAQYCPAAVIRDHAQGRLYAVTAPGRESLLTAIVQDAERSMELPAIADMAPLGLTLDEAPAADYLAGVERIRGYIREGDVFQVNLSRAWTGTSAAGHRAAEVYARLRRTNPAPFAALATLGTQAIVSSSPERLIAHENGWLSTRPIAGTRPRGADADSDRALLEALAAHPKERAEHVMLIDLEGNDLGRVARTGTVEVDELMVTESYAHVHHIVSNVRARPRAGLRPSELIRAVFPGGTITGCPKIRCMQILRELEGAARGAYTGAIGYLGDNGRMDLNILIRTLEWNDGELRFRTGAGIVADSQPEAELAETRHKAEGLIRALG